jgi:hypothetical protein
MFASFLSSLKFFRIKPVDENIEITSIVFSLKTRQPIIDWTFQLKLERDDIHDNNIQHKGTHNNDTKHDGPKHFLLFYN